MSRYKCPNCGWISWMEIKYDEKGNEVCDICETSLKDVPQNHEQMPLDYSKTNGISKI